MTKDKLILIVDDDEDDRDIFCDAVKEIDPTLECIKARDGQDALEVLTKMTDLPGYIFLDLNMPKLNGVQCLAQLKRNETTKNIPVFIYSTSQRREDAEETLRLGAEKFISKPALYTEIRDTIASALGRLGTF